MTAAEQVAPDADPKPEPDAERDRPHAFMAAWEAHKASA